MMHDSISTQSDGRTATFAGCYVSRQTVADVDSSLRSGTWLLYSATIQLSPPETTAEQLLVQRTLAGQLDEE